VVRSFRGRTEAQGRARKTHPRTPAGRLGPIQTTTQTSPWVRPQPPRLPDPTASRAERHSRNSANGRPRRLAYGDKGRQSRTSLGTLQIWHGRSRAGSPLPHYRSAAQSMRPERVGSRRLRSSRSRRIDLRSRSHATGCAISLRPRPDSTTRSPPCGTACRSSADDRSGSAGSPPKRSMFNETHQQAELGWREGDSVQKRLRLLPRAGRGLWPTGSLW
jgi:hypothetical protein